MRSKALRSCKEWGCSEAGGRARPRHSGPTPAAQTHESLQLQERRSLSKTFLPLVRTKKTGCHLAPLVQSEPRPRGSNPPTSQGQVPCNWSCLSLSPTQLVLRSQHLYLRGPLQLHLELRQLQSGLCQGLTKPFILPSKLHVQLGTQSKQAGLEGPGVGHQQKPQHGRVGHEVGCCTFRKLPSGSSCSCLDSGLRSLCERCLRAVEPPSTVLDRNYRS